MAETIAENKAIVRRWVHEVFNQHQLDSVGELKVSEYIDWNPYPGQQTALAGFKSVLENFFTAFPDFHYDVDEELGEGDIIICIGTWSGTHTNPLMGIPPTGKRLSAKRIDVVRIVGDKMTERWGTGNELKMMELFGFGGPPQPTVDSLDNKVIARRFIEEVLNQRNLVAIERFIDDQAVQDPRSSLAMFLTFAAFPDAQVRIDNLIAENDKVTAILTLSGTQLGEFMGIAPTRRRVTTQALLTLQIANGRIIESRYELELPDIARQVGKSGQPSPARGRAATNSGASETMSPMSEKKAVVRRFMDEVVNQKNIGAMEQLLGSNARDHLKESLTTLLFLAAFPDACANVERIIEEGNRVTVVSTTAGTHKGAFLGRPPTGQGVHVRRIDVFTVDGGKIVDVLHNFDLVSLVHQIGAFPSRAVYEVA